MFIIIRSKLFFLFIGREPTTWPANNYLQMRNAVQLFVFSVCLQIIFCSCVKETLLFSFLKTADPFASQGYSLKKQTRWLNDKTIIELSYRKISWFVSVSQTNHDILLNLVQ